MRSAKTFGTILLLLVASVASGQDREPMAIGFLELPTIFGQQDPNGQPEQVAPDNPKAIPLRARPGDKAPIVGNVTDANSIAAEEFDYEELAAVVYEVSGRWALVRLINSATSEYGWLPMSLEGRFHSLPDLFARNLCYLTEDWDRSLFIGPGDPEVVEITEAAGPHVDVLGSKWIGSELWLEVALLNPGHCEGVAKQAIVNGWIPLYQNDGKRNVWFYPRGC